MFKFDKYFLYGALAAVVVIAILLCISAIFFHPSSADSNTDISVPIDPITGCSLTTNGEDMIIEYTATGDETLLRIEPMDWGYHSVYAPYDFPKPKTGKYTIHKPFIYGVTSWTVMRISVVRGNDIIVGYYRT